MVKNLPLQHLKNELAIKCVLYAKMNSESEK